MNTQPVEQAIDYSKVFDGKILFGDLPVGSVVTFEDKRTVKITNTYFNIRPYENGAQSKMINAMIEKTGELIHVPQGLVFRI
jgi:hypothetical protein